MKRILMIALMAFPAVAFSQTELKRGESTETKARPARPGAESVEAVYVEVIASASEKGETTVSVQMGNDVFDNSTDKESMVQLKTLSEMTFKTVPDAMAYLAKLNFKYLDSYTLPGANGRDTAHLVFEKRMLGKAAREEMQERQSVAKPTTGAKPAATTAPAPKK